MTRPAVKLLGCAVIGGFLLALASVAILLFCTQARSTDLWPTLLKRSPSGRHLVFTNLHDLDKLNPVLVIDIDGQLELSTEADLSVGAIDRADDWFPDGKALLISRSQPNQANQDVRNHGLLVVRLGTAQTESLSGGRGGLTNGLVVGDRSVICRTEPENLEEPGLYLYTRTGQGWESSLLLADARNRIWRECMYASRKGESWTMVVRAEEERKGKPTMWSYWQVKPATAKPAEENLLARVQPSSSADMSRDGSLLAIRPIDSKTLILTGVPADQGQTQHLELEEELRFCSFSPDGKKLLLWVGGALGAARYYDRAPKLFWMGLEGKELHRVKLPYRYTQLERLSDAAWIDSRSIAVGFVNYGIAVVDIETGRWKTIWRAPARD